MPPKPGGDSSESGLPYMAGGWRPAAYGRGRG